MKAPYAKPLLAVDVFSVSQSVTRDCTSTVVPSQQLTNTNPYDCYWDNGNPEVFIFAAGGVCNLDGEMVGMACYNTYSEDNFVFNS